MKAETANRRYRSNIVGTKVRMGFAEGAEQHLMGILSGMYPNPELAIVREYSTNAYDSHIEAGQTRPIEFTPPTPYLPTMTVRDYGIGLDEEGIRELYSQYGASSKRNTNSAQGMLGIGCKSALAYNDQFTVVGFKNGVRTQVVISRDEDGAASQHIVAVDAGEYENGVEVTIPVKADNDILNTAYRFFSFWPEGSVVIAKGDKWEEPRKIGSAAVEEIDAVEYRSIWLDDRTLLTNEVGQDLVVMGYVAYPLVEGEERLFGLQRITRPGSNYIQGRGYVTIPTYSAVCFVDIGEVNFAPSREVLQTTARTRAKLDELRQHVKSTFEANIRAQIAAAKDAKQAQELLIAGKEMGFDPAVPATWQGREVVLHLLRGEIKKNPNTGKEYQEQVHESESVARCLKYTYLFTSAHSYASRKQGERMNNLKLSQPLPIFTAFNGKWLTNVKRAKLELWASKKGLSIGSAVMVDKLSKDEKFWTSGWTIYDWNEVEATELPKTTAADGTTVRLKGSYNGIVDGDTTHSIPAHKINTKKPLYYTHGNQWVASQHHALRSGAVSKQGATIIALSQNRVEKFMRDFPMAVELNDAAKEAANKWAAKIDREQIKAHAVRAHRAAHTLVALKDEDFDDPSLNTLIRLANTDCSDYESGLEKFSRWVSEQDASAVRKLLESTTAKYPLAEWNSYSGPGGKTLEHTVLYLNAAIAAEKE